MLPQAIHAQGDEIAGKQFGQRRCNCLEQGAIPDQIEVGVHGIANPRQNLISAHHALALEARRLRQANPAFDSALVRGVTVMVHNALTPGAAEFRILAAREDDRIFDRNPALIVVAIERPRLHLPAAQLSLVHHQMKRMLMVISFFSHGAQAHPQLFRSQNRWVVGGYRSTRHPSSAISQPAARTSRYSAPDSSSMGLVLFT